MLVVLGLVFTLAFTIYNQSGTIVSYNNLTHSTLIELIWTITPALVLLAIALPSFRALYMSDEVLTSAITIKAIGHQWYWSFSYDDITEPISFDSYMVTAASLEAGDNPLVLPIGTTIRVLGTSTDVIHSFAMPSLGVKVDCLPGRLNQTNLLINRSGTFYGQCSELCGAYHSFMPIRLDAVSPNQYVGWLRSQL